jgi:hypothetical protein
MSDEKLGALVQSHLARYPQSEILDVYKLLHQATFGPGHAIASKKAAREWLEQEVALLMPPSQEPLTESIHPEGQIVRLYLRPYLEQGGKVNLLLDAFVRSADQVRPDAALMAQRWQVFDAACRSEAAWTQRFDRHEVVLFSRVRQHENWPAVHHSPTYETAYHPKYRVLTRSEAESLCAKLRIEFVLS